MRKNINLGAYGWRHQHWLNTFYPEDLPIDKAEDWRLAYYSNEFKAVMVPFDYWRSGEVADCEGWLDDVDDDFQFFVECRESMLANISLSELTDNLKKLQPQLSALVFLENKQAEGELFKPLVNALEVNVFASAPIINLSTQSIWRQDNPQPSRFAFIDSELSDLKSARIMVENFVNSAECLEQKAGLLTEVVGENMIIIVNFPQLLTSNLSQFRTLLEIMGH